MVLEDDRAFALDLERALQPLGCEVILLDDGSVGLARAVSERVDLVVVSAELRGTNGFRVCNRIKKYRGGRPTPVIITWTEASASAREEHGRLPTAADSYIKRPFGASDLRGQVRAHVTSLSTRSSLEMPAVRVSITSPISNVPDDPSSRRRLSGVSPASAGPGNLAKLERDLAAAQADHGTMDRLRGHLADLENDNARLVRELETARASAVAPPRRPPPLPTDDAAKRELAATKELFGKKDLELVALKRDLDAAREELGRARAAVERRRDGELARLRASEDARATYERKVGTLERTLRQTEEAVAHERAARLDAAKALAVREADHETKLADLLLVQSEVTASKRALENKLAERDKEQAGLEAQLAEKMAEHAAKAVALESLEASHAAARGELAAAEEGRRSATRALEEERAARAATLRASAVAHAEQEARVLEELLAEARARLETASATVDTYRNELGTAQAALDERVRDLAEARRAKEQGIRTVLAQEATLEKMRAAQKSTDLARREAEERARSAATALEKTQRAHASERGALQSRLREAEARVTTAERDLETTRASLGDARAELNGRIAEPSFEERRVALERSVGDLEALVAGTREALDFERRDRLREEGAWMNQVDELEARIAERDTELTEARRESAELREEIPALEAEIAALRSEVASARTKLDNEAALVRAANDQLERNKKLLDRARAALAELVDATERTGGS